MQIKYENLNNVYNHDISLPVHYVLFLKSFLSRYVLFFKSHAFKTSCTLEKYFALHIIVNHNFKKILAIQMNILILWKKLFLICFMYAQTYM